MKNLLWAIILVFPFLGCKKAADENADQVKIHFLLTFDSTQVRLNGFGEPVNVAAGHAAQSPRFNSMSAHYVELAPSAYTPLGSGQVLYHAPEVNTGGATAIDFNQSHFAGNNQEFLAVPIKDFAPGSYEWLRVSLAYQNYTVSVHVAGMMTDATIASFIGYNTYIHQYKIKDSIVTVNGNRLQGYWAFETGLLGYGFVQTGQAPPGATTVPNPIFNTSPVPAGSCVVTGKFASPLIISGNETQDVFITVSLSTNKSFEWKDNDANGLFDPANGDTVIDMGIRGLIPIKQ